MPLKESRRDLLPEPDEDKSPPTMGTDDVVAEFLRELPDLPASSPRRRRPRAGP